jgi:heme-degrading monooxygenase HmoA
MREVAGGMPDSVQWMKLPPGASGSSSTSTSSAACGGTLDHASGGDVPAPSQVNRFGIGAPSRNAGLVSRTVGALEGARISTVFPPPPHPPRAATTTAASALDLTALAFTVPVAFHASKGRCEMHARMSRIAGLPPERIEEARQYFEQQELPALEQQKGFEGVLVMVDRADGRATAITFWATQEDMRASDRAAEEARAATLDQVRSSEPSREPVVERYEVLIQK